MGLFRLCLAPLEFAIRAQIGEVATMLRAGSPGVDVSAFLPTLILHVGHGGLVLGGLYVYSNVYALNICLSG